MGRQSKQNSKNTRDQGDARSMAAMVAGDPCDAALMSALLIEVRYLRGAGVHLMRPRDEDGAGCGAHVGDVAREVEVKGGGAILPGVLLASWWRRRGGEGGEEGVRGAVAPDVAQVTLCARAYNRWREGGPLEEDAMAKQRDASAARERMRRWQRRREGRKGTCGVRGHWQRTRVVHAPDLRACVSVTWAVKRLWCSETQAAA